MDIDKGIVYEDRLFCSNKCVEKYKKKSDMKCSYCHKNFFSLLLMLYFRFEINHYLILASYMFLHISTLN